MTSEECIAQIRASGLYSETDAQQWADRIQKVGLTDALAGELFADTQRRAKTVMETMGITNKKSTVYKEVLMDFYSQLKGIASEYRSEEKQIEKEGTDMLRKEDQLEAAQHIAESKAAIATMTEKKKKNS